MNSLILNRAVSSPVHANFCGKCFNYLFSAGKRAQPCEQCPFIVHDHIAARESMNNWLKWLQSQSAMKKTTQ